MLTFFCPSPLPPQCNKTEKGRLVASLSLGPTEKRVAMGDALNDDLWHSFRFKFNNNFKPFVPKLFPYIYHPLP